MIATGLEKYDCIFFMSTWNDPRKKFESCLKKKVSFDNGINCFWFESRKGSNHLSTKGLM